MSQITLEIDDAKVRAMLQGASLAAFRPEQAWKETAAYMRARTDMTFRRLRRGGTYRGVTWREFANQYTRKTDGQVVPAWGGVPRIAWGWKKAKDLRPGRAGKVSTGVRMSRITGVVSGRLRPSGTRVTKTSALMQDTMTMRGRAATVVRQEKGLLMMGPQGVSYAAHQNAMRPFLFFELPTDGTAIARIFAEHIMRGAGGGSGARPPSGGGAD